MHDTQIQEVSEQFYDAIALDDLSGDEEDSENEEEQSLLKNCKVAIDFKLHEDYMYIMLKGVTHEFGFASYFGGKCKQSKPPERSSSWTSRLGLPSKRPPSKL